MSAKENAPGHSREGKPRNRGRLGRIRPTTGQRWLTGVTSFSDRLDDKHASPPRKSATLSLLEARDTGTRLLLEARSARLAPREIVLTVGVGQRRFDGRHNDDEGEICALRRSHVRR